MGTGGVENKCRAAVLYYEPAAYATTQYVLKSNGLDVVEKKKLKLGPYILESTLQIDEKTHIQGGDKASYSDMEDVMEFKGEYGNPESLALKGL